MTFHTPIRVAWAGAYGARGGLTERAVVRDRDRGTLAWVRRGGFFRMTRFSATASPARFWWSMQASHRLVVMIVIQQIVVGITPSGIFDYGECFVHQFAVFAGRGREGSEARFDDGLWCIVLYLKNSVVVSLILFPKPGFPSARLFVCRTRGCLTPH